MTKLGLPNVRQLRSNSAEGKKLFSPELLYLPIPLLDLTVLEIKFFSVGTCYLVFNVVAK